jgi:SSS family solute:Na+ symporter
MAITFFTCLVVMTIIKIVKPLADPVEFKLNTSIELTTSNGAKWAGIVVIILTLILYVIFSPLVLAK